MIMLAGSWLADGEEEIWRRGEKFSVIKIEKIFAKLQRFLLCKLFSDQKFRQNTQSNFAIAADEFCCCCC